MRKSTIDKLGEHINQITEIPQEVKKEYRKKSFYNLLLGMVFIIYITGIVLLEKNLDRDVFFNCYKIFSIGLLLITIVVFEYGYKKDNGFIFLFGVETLIISIITLFFKFIIAKENYVYCMSLIIIYILIYYIAKGFIISKNSKKEYLKLKNDIPEIIKKESKDKLKSIMEKEKIYNKKQRKETKNDNTKKSKGGKKLTNKTNKKEPKKSDNKKTKKK